MALHRALTLTLVLLLALINAPIAPGADFVRADTDASGKLDISDAVRTLGFLFLGEKMPLCLDAADANDSGRVDIADASYVLGFLFSGGKAPPAPFPSCGADASSDGLDCREFAGCTGPPADSPPAISRLTAAPSKLPRPALGSFFASQLAFDFADPEGDVVALVVRTIAPDGSSTSLELSAVTLGVLGTAGNASHQVVFTATSLLGSHEYRLRLLDAGGNESPEAVVSILLTEGGTPRLDITSMTPLSGTAGDVVTLRGNGLGAERGRTKVALSGVAAVVSAEGPGWIDCVVPTGAVTGPVQISSPRGSAIAKVQFVVKPHLTILPATEDGLTVLETRRFEAVATGLGDPSVLWYVDGERGGFSSSGLITKDGTYTAPAVPPTAGLVTISCIAVADDSVRAQRTLRLVPPQVLRGAGVVRALSGGAVEASSGLAALAFAPGVLASDLKLTRFEARHLMPGDSLPGVSKAQMPLAVLDVESTEAPALKAGMDLRVLLPCWTPAKTPHAVFAHDGKSLFVDTGLTAMTDATGTLVTVRLDRLGPLALVRLEEAIPVRPSIQFPGPRVRTVSTPATAIEEGLTLPVLITGSNFWPAFTRVKPADPALLLDLEMGPVFINDVGTELGFTLRIKPMSWLQGGQTLPVAFRIERVNTAGLPVASIDTDPSQFVIEGLPELMVSPNAASDVYTIDGLHIDRLLNDSARFSTVVVERGAALGIGRTVANTSTADGFSRNLTSLDAFEESFGKLDWVESRGLDRSRVRIFQPEHRLVWLDVTGPVTLDGVVVFAGMRGGENAALALASGPGVARLGGLSGSTLSGGMGGDGGRSVGAITRNGLNAGNGVRERGIGHGAGGVAVAQLVAAGFGARLDPQIETIDDLVSSAIAAVNPFSPPAGLAEIAVNATKVFIEGAKLSSTATLNRNAPENIIAGQGGHGGLRGTNAAPEMPDDTRIVPGSGGGGGGGGGSSTYQATLFGFSVAADERVGGGGAGGGGAAGALRITTASLFTVGPAGRLDGSGGRGGAGEPHRWIASPGGSGGGGAGAMAKLQATRFLSQGRVDISGGERAASVLAQSTSPSPDYASGRVQALQGDSKGGFIYYGCVCPWLSVASPTVKLCWPTGRKRADLTLSSLTGIRGIGTATQVFLFPLPLIPPATNGLLIVDEHKQVWFTGIPDYMAPDPTPSICLQIFDLRTVPQMNGLTPTDITQSPVAPHHYFVSGVRGRLQDAVATSEILELDLSFQFVRTVFSARTVESAGGTPFIGHLRDLDFLSDGRLVGLMALRSNFDQGIHVIDTTTGTASLHLNLQSRTRSMSVVRGNVDQFVVSVGTSGVVAADGGAPPTGIERWDVNGLTAHAALALETISEPGVPGLVRIDGALAGSNAPQARFDGSALPRLVYDNQPVAFGSPAVGSFAARASAGLGLESLVFGRRSITAFSQGAEPGALAEVWRESSQRPLFAVPSPVADVQGRFESTIQLDTGFNTVWVETSRGGATHPLLKRHVLYIENASTYPPRPQG